MRRRLEWLSDNVAIRRKRPSKRRWKARLRLGLPAPHTAVVEYALDVTGCQKDCFRQFWVRKPHAPAS